MSKRRRFFPGVSGDGEPRQPAVPAAAPAPDAALPPGQPERPRSWLAGRRMMGLIAAGAVALAVGAYARRPAAPTGGPPEQLERLCQQFMALKNRGDPAANDLLTAAPAVPATAVSEEEAGRLDTRFILREPYEIIDVQPDADDPAHCVLVCKGNCSSQPLSVRTGEGVERSQRLLLNPDIVVELSDGKIDGVRVRLHQEPQQENGQASDH